MGTQDRARIVQVDAWLADGGAVLAANERAARSMTSAFHAARLAEGRTAWPTPSIFSWDSWVQKSWLERNDAGLMLLNPLQEQALWTKAIARSKVGANLLHRSRLAASAQRAFRLLCDYAPGDLKAPARLGWAGDAAVFSEWLEAFQTFCRREVLISNSLLTQELTELLAQGSVPDFQRNRQRPPLLLVGFDRLLDTQEELLNAWGPWQLEGPGEAARSTRFLTTQDSEEELAACVDWLREQLTANPDARLMVVTTALGQRRGELERAMLQAPTHAAEQNLSFEFSLGVPMGQVSLARSALLILRWLHAPLSEPEVDWLVGCGHCAASADEETSLAESMRQMRRRGKERPGWALEEFAKALGPDDHSSYRDGGAVEDSADPRQPSPGQSQWAERMISVRDRLLALPTWQSPQEWVEQATQLLESTRWPGFRPPTSDAFQARQRWERVMEDCGSLSFDGSQIEWADFVSTLADAVESTIFAVESSDAQVLITEPLEAAGQAADGIWFLGANEENWPGRGQPHPLLPIGLQRDTGMPHASPLADWKLAQQANTRLLASADEVVFSYSRHSAESEARPSRLVTQLIGTATALPPRAQQTAVRTDLTESFEDTSRIPFPHVEIGGGAATLTSQSQCPFQAFATARLGAEDWQPAEVGLNAKQRGQLLHSVLHRIWAGPEVGGIRTLAELQTRGDLRGFVDGAVRSVLRESFDPTKRNSMPARFPERYLQLEAERLTRLVTEWLEYERKRLPFTVVKTEARGQVTIAGLTLDLRLDRVDELQNGAQLVIDYKSSDTIGPRSWEGKRPDDLQLPLYASFAVNERLEGLLIAQVRPRKSKFKGRLRDAATSLRTDLTGRNSLVSEPLTDAQLTEWRDRIERLGKDFLAGHADVDPKKEGKPCKTCHLHAVCRIYENQPLVVAAGEESSVGDESESAEGIDD